MDFTRLIRIDMEDLIPGKKYYIQRKLMLRHAALKKNTLDSLKNSANRSRKRLSFLTP